MSIIALLPTDSVFSLSHRKEQVLQALRSESLMARWELHRLTWPSEASKPGESHLISPNTFIIYCLPPGRSAFLQRHCQSDLNQNIHQTWVLTLQYRRPNAQWLLGIPSSFIPPKGENGISWCKFAYKVNSLSHTHTNKQKHIHKKNKTKSHL